MFVAAERERLATALTKVISIVPSPDAVGQFLAELGNVGPAGLFILLGTVAGVTYLVFRPLFSPFRVKRALFNLAADGPVDLTRTTMAGHVARSAGLYETERAVFARLGTRPPREAGIDLWISAAGLAALILPVVAGVDYNLSIDDSFTAVWAAGIGSGLIAARAGCRGACGRNGIGPARCSRTRLN